jgi:hypothetical protein
MVFMKLDGSEFALFIHLAPGSALASIEGLPPTGRHPVEGRAKEEDFIRPVTPDK